MVFARWACLLLFGLVSLLGQGLHLFSSCDCAGHIATASHVAAQERAHQTGNGETNDGETVTCSCGHRHARRVATEHAGAAESELLVGQTSARGPHHDDDCQICQFFTQGQIISAALALTTCQHITSCGFTAAPQSPSLPAIEPYQARGPPTTAS